MSWIYVRYQYPLPPKYSQFCQVRPKSLHLCVQFRSVHCTHSVPAQKHNILENSKCTLTSYTYSGRPKYKPFSKKEFIFAATYFRTEA